MAAPMMSAEWAMGNGLTMKAACRLSGRHGASVGSGILSDAPPLTRGRRAAWAQRGRAFASRIMARAPR